MAHNEPHMAHKEPHVDHSPEPRVALCEPCVALCEPGVASGTDEPRVARSKPCVAQVFLQCTTSYKASLQNKTIFTFLNHEILSLLFPKATDTHVKQFEKVLTLVNEDNLSMCTNEPCTQSYYTITYILL